MSIAVEQLKVARVIDPRTDAGAPSDRIYNAFEGAADISYQNLSQDGGVSNTSLTFTLNPPSPKVFVNRRVMISMGFQLDFTGVSAGAGQALLQAAGLPFASGVNPGTTFTDAPRSYPIARALQTVQFSLGNDRLSQNLGQYWTGMTRYSNDVESQDLWHSMTPTMLDQSQEYNTTGLIPSIGQGSARNPLRGYGDNPLQCPRGGFIGAQVVANTSTGIADTARVLLNCTEMIDLSPFLFEKGKQDVGFIGVQNQSLTVTLGGKGNGALSGLAASLWSHANIVGGSVLSGVAVTVLTANVKVSYLTPDPVMQIPRSMNYNYSEITYYPTTVQANVNPGASTVITQNNIQLNSIPSRILFWVARQDSSYSIFSTDTAFGITNINLSFDNRDSLLSNATQEDLYQICVKNGSNCSWRQFTNDVGSYIALDFGEDIPLRATQAPGLRGTYNLRLTVTCTNLGAAAVIPTLNLVVIAEGVLSIIDQNVIRNVGVLSESDVLNSKNQPGKAYHATGSVYGGSFWSKLGDFARNIGRPLLNVARTVAPMFNPALAAPLELASSVASAVGVGVRQRRGGKAISRKQLALMMR
jgi:hypothetical protein